MRKERRLKAFIFEFHEKRSLKGFTLIELLVVIGIMGALAWVSAPFLSTFLGGKQLTTTTDKVVRTLRKAQNYALSGKEDDVWGVHYESGLLVLFKGDDYGDRETGFDEKFNLPRTVNIVNDDTEWTDVYFQKLRGKPEPQTLMEDDKITITITMLNEERTVTINSEGMIDIIDVQ